MNTKNIVSIIVVVVALIIAGGLAKMLNVKKAIKGFLATQTTEVLRKAPEGEGMKIL
ncbi:MAG: hypothetical protein GF350_08125, partial [Chitinivibrionales bacterium]|nr:hypothetical protein [Chitinivibrionales bacterium]